jgi:hypothetical protein
MRYWPNPAHKQETTEAGPPQWRPGKEPCPREMTVAERDELLTAAEYRKCAQGFGCPP